MFPVKFASKTFEIRKDTRPLLELVLTPSSSSVAYRDGSIKVKVKVKAVAKNPIIGTSGFRGTLNVVCGERGVAIFKKIERIQDDAIIEIDFEKDLKISEIDETKNFDLVASFLHDDTNKTFKASTTFSVEVSDFKISVIHSPKYFKPGIPYTFSLQVSRIDGFPVLNSEIPLLVTVKDNEANLVSRNFDLDPKAGTAKVGVKGITSNTTYLNIKASYSHAVYSGKVYRTPSKQKEFVAANILTAR
jgi:hypothetical protein